MVKIFDIRFLMTLTAVSFANSAHAQSWQELDCIVVREFLEEREANTSEELLESARKNRQLLMLTLRGVDYNAFERIRNSLGTERERKGNTPTSNDAELRPQALLRDRCEP